MIVKYSKKFPYAPYLNEDIGFEESINDGATDEEMLASLRRLSSVAMKFHKENNPQLDFELTDAETIKWEAPLQGSGQSVSLGTGRTLTITHMPVKNIEAERTEAAIDNATTLHELDLLMGDAAKYGLAAQLNAKKKQLNSK